MPILSIELGKETIKINVKCTVKWIKFKIRSLFWVSWLFKLELDFFVVFIFFRSKKSSQFYVIIRKFIFIRVDLGLVFSIFSFFFFFTSLELQEAPCVRGRGRAQLVSATCNLVFYYWHNLLFYQKPKKENVEEANGMGLN